MLRQSPKIGHFSQLFGQISVLLQRFGSVRTAFGNLRSSDNAKLFRRVTLGTRCGDSISGGSDAPMRSKSRYDIHVIPPINDSYVQVERYGKGWPAVRQVLKC